MNCSKKMKIFIYAVLSAVFLSIFAIKVFAEDLPVPTSTPDWDAELDNSFNNSISSWKVNSGIQDLENVLTKIDTLKNKDYKALAPVFTVNLHDLSKHFESREVTIANFREMEKYQYMGFSVIDYFRFIISGFLYFETGMYIWANLHKGSEGNAH